MPFYENGPVRIHYEEAGDGPPLLLIPGGGLNGDMTKATTDAPYNPVEEFKNEFRCITFDRRNSAGGQSTGPLEIDGPWESYTDDLLGLADHLGLDRFLTLGFCIGGPLTWHLLRRAEERVVASVLTQPSGFRPEMPDYFFENNMKVWGKALAETREDISIEDVEAFLTTMYRSDPDFVISVTRDDVRNCQTPVLILPDDATGHPYKVAMEAAMLAPNAQVSLYPWKDTEDKIPLAVRHIRMFLQTHRRAFD
ncbi:MAG TPA: alpha/beta hydrolase [Rhodospirillaceae bacterium]|nr:alpha/beta hydrolase [Rhodospirillaceae bacterium]HAT35328.1 alpha/beta hydrolase [Rhodospirillaceae bacterium]